MLRRIRKILKTGGSLAVVLPRDWVEGNGLEAGSTVEISYDGAEVRVRARRENLSEEDSRR